MKLKQVGYHCHGVNRIRGHFARRLAENKPLGQSIAEPESDGRKEDGFK